MAAMYTSADTGAPAITSGSGNAFSFNAFKTILKACLVTGYDSKAAAGWTLVAEDSNYLVLRNGPGTGYICFTLHATSPSVRITLAATYDGVASNIITGLGVKTGLSANNGVPQSFYISGLAANSRLCWGVVADARSAVLTSFWYTNNSGAVYENMTGVSAPGGTLVFGEDSSGNFIALGGINTSSAAGGTTNGFDATGMTVLRNPATGVLIDTGSISLLTPLGPGTTSGTAVYPLERVDLVRYPWMTTAKDSGFIRGVAVHPAATGFMNYALRSVGRGSAVADLTLSNATTPFELVAGLPVFPLKIEQTPGSLFGTVDARFW